MTQARWQFFRSDAPLRVGSALVGLGLAMMPLERLFESGRLSFGDWVLIGVGSLGIPWLMLRGAAAFAGPARDEHWSGAIVGTVGVCCGALLVVGVVPAMVAAAPEPSALLSGMRFLMVVTGGTLLLLGVCGVALARWSGRSTADGARQQ